MNKYIIYCTTEQTAKAYDLGARTKLNIGLYAFCPTAEQMIGWLEDKGNFREINVQEFANFWEYNLYTSSEDVVSHKGHYNSRREATLAAIDAALEYLTSKK